MCVWDVGSIGMSYSDAATSLIADIKDVAASAIDVYMAAIYGIYAAIYTSMAAYIPYIAMRGRCLDRHLVLG